MSDNSRIDEVIIKLDKLAADTAAILTTQALWNARLEEQDRQLRMLSDIVRGGPGVSGLVTDIAVVKKMLTDICDSEYCRKQKRQEAKEKEESDDNETHITWKWMLDKAIVPVITGFVLWFLLTVLPDLLVFMSSTSP